VTLQTAQIQALIAEIDAVLSKDSKSRFGWLVGEDTPEQRRVLELVRDHLQKWQKELASETGITNLRILFDESHTGPGEFYPRDLNEIEDLQTKLLEQLQSEIVALERRKKALLTEIYQLEQKRQNSGLPETSPAKQQQLITEFSQELIGRLQEAVNQEVTDILAKIKAEQPLNQEEIQSQVTELQTEGLNWSKLPQKPEEESLIPSAEPLPYAGVELSREMLQKLQEDEFDWQESETELTDLTEIFAPEDEDEVAADIPPSDIISALTDLIQDQEQILISTEENLLVVGESEKSKIDLWVSGNIVEELNEDLTSLEGIDSVDIQEPEEEDVLPTIVEVTNSIELDLAAAVEQEKITFPIPEHILVEFDDLFGDSDLSITPLDSLGLESETTPLSVSDSDAVEAEKKN